MKSSIAFPEAIKSIYPLCKVESEEIPLVKAKGRILAESICADRDFPPFDRVMMDGYAICLGKQMDPPFDTFAIVKEQVIGKQPKLIVSYKEAIPVSTGCVLPKGANAVIPIEWTKLWKDRLSIKDNYQIKKRQYIHQQASDYGSGETLLKRGTFLQSPELSIIASCGHSRIKVAKKLRIGLLVTGSELIPIDEKPDPFQQRRSNEISISSIVEALTGDLPQVLFAGEEYESVLQGISQLKQSCDLILSTGGLALGAGDFTIKALEALGYKIQFHGVNQKPGKPIAYGIHPKTHQQVLALPGSPVSAIVTARIYLPQILFHPASKPLQVVLKNRPKLLPNMSALIPGKIVDSGKIDPIYLQNSGDFATLKASRGIIYCPPSNVEDTANGMEFLFYPWL